MIQKGSFRLSDNSVLYHWLLDRIASGFNYDVLSVLYTQEFGLNITENEYEEFVRTNRDALDERYEELKRDIYNSGIYSKLQLITNKLYEEIERNPDLTPREISSLADSLRRNIETLANVSKSKTEVKQVTNNNYLVLQGLADEGLIQITNPDKLKRLIDGSYEEEETNH